MNPNPFGIPDFNALGGSNNPLLRSMDMMAQAWKNMAGGGAGDVSSGMMPSLSPDDLDRRIRDLRAVESWLQLNLSMLSTTIQGLEIQRSTLAAIKTMAQQGTQAAGGKNPFEAFMAFNPLAAGAAGAAGVASSVAEAKVQACPPETGSHTAAQPASMPSPSSPPQSEAAASQNSPGDKQPGAQQDADAGAGNPAAQAWWNMLQQQFDAMATATAASMQQVENYRQQASKAKAAGSSKPAKPAAANAHTSAKTSAPAAARTVKPSAKAATKSAAKVATKTAAKKTATRSTTRSTKKN